MAKKNDDFTICSLNLNGVRAAGKRGFTDWLAKTQPDHLCLQELRAMPDQVGDELRAPAGYGARWNPARNR